MEAGREGGREGGLPLSQQAQGKTVVVRAKKSHKRPSDMAGGGEGGREGGREGLPRPVGKATRVFLNRASLTMSSW